jgi:hypothetical protein
MNLYKNLRTKIIKCCAHIYCNKPCLIKNFTSKYANIWIPYTSTAANNTQKEVQIILLKDEIKYLLV